MKRTSKWLVLIALFTCVATAIGAQDPSADGASAVQVNPGAGVSRALQDHLWTLAAATDGENRTIDALFPVSTAPFILTFSASRLNLQGGCNTLSGAYGINARDQLVTANMMSTMRACEPTLMKAEAALAAMFAGPLQMDVIPGPQPELRLRTALNETLQFDGQPTPESLYGPAKLVFLEVGPQLVACENPAGLQAMCLQVREIQFDTQGLREGLPGQWLPFPDSIDGYKHTPGERNIIRVKRFDRGAAPGDATSGLYILDLVVETETAP